jgi:hydroxymethylpyrimidine/phosphomethylpyrimidine kinase
VKEFKALVDEMVQVVDDILKCPDEISKIDPDSINELIEKLMELQTAANTNTEEAETA